jgi:large subunit ribosomal protein L20
MKGEIQFFRLKTISNNLIDQHVMLKKKLCQSQRFLCRRKTFGQLPATREKQMCYAYRDRKVNKRNFRALWIQRINAGARLKECLILNHREIES